MATFLAIFAAKRGFMNILNFVFWNADPELFSIGPVHVRWYGLLFAMAFLLGQRLMTYIFKTEEKPEKDVDSLTIHMIIAVVVGARLGHVLFYGPYFTTDGDGYFDDPLSILKIWEGGLASHGAAIGILFATWLYQRKRKVSFLWTIDRIVIVVALAGCFIRFGNLMNSEIVGSQTNNSAGFVFARNIENGLHYTNHDIINVDVIDEGSTTTVNDTLLQNITVRVKFADNILSDTVAIERTRNVLGYHIRAGKDPKDAHHYEFTKLPEEGFKPTIVNKDNNKVVEFPALAVGRHAAQLYESISTGILFIVLFLLYRKYKAGLPEGLLFGIFLVYIFTLRLLYEFVKENQSELLANNGGLPLNMGQLLSIPLIIAGVIVLVRALRSKTAPTE